MKHRLATHCATYCSDYGIHGDTKLISHISAFSLASIYSAAMNVVGIKFSLVY